MTAAVVSLRRPGREPVEHPVEALVALADCLSAGRRPDPAAAALSGVAPARNSSRRSRRTRTNVHGTVPPRKMKSLFHRKAWADGVSRDIGARGSPLLRQKRKPWADSRPLAAFLAWKLTDWMKRSLATLASAVVS
jgi:hypothetical protein